MTQTAEGYIIDRSVVPEDKLLDYTDDSAWPTDKLIESLTHDYNQMTLVGNNPERAHQIGRSIMQKGFELTMRGVNVSEL